MGKVEEALVRIFGHFILLFHQPNCGGSSLDVRKAEERKTNQEKGQQTKRNSKLLCLGSIIERQRIVVLGGLDLRSDPNSVIFYQWCGLEQVTELS